MFVHVYVACMHAYVCVCVHVCVYCVCVLCVCVLNVHETIWEFVDHYRWVPARLEPSQAILPNKKSRMVDVLGLNGQEVYSSLAAIQYWWTRLPSTFLGNFEFL